MKRLFILAILLGSLPSLAAVGATNLTSGNNNSCTSPQTTASITPGTNDLILITVKSQKASGNGPLAPTVTGDGLTWVHVADTTFGAVQGTGNARRITTLRAMGTPSTGTLSIAWSSASIDCQWTVDDFSGTNTSGTNGSGAIVQAVTAATTASTASPATVTMASFSSASNASYGAAGTSTANVMTAGTGMTRLAHNESPTDIESEWAVGNINPITANYTTNSVSGIIGIEIAAATASVPRHFPIVY